MPEPSFFSVRLLGFDVGQARIGIARSTALGGAEPVTTLQAKQRPWAEIEQAIAAYINRFDPTEFVVGLPRNMDGSIGPQAQLSQAFGRKLQAAFPTIPLFFEDERLTTDAGYERLAAAGIRGAKARERIDQMAACIIVEARLARLARDWAQAPPPPPPISEE